MVGATAASVEADSLALQKPERRRPVRVRREHLGIRGTYLDVVDEALREYLRSYFR
jgi:hypothetical protein